MSSNHSPGISRTPRIPRLPRIPPMLLHICCAPCSPYVVEELQRDYDLTLYFYNPNIHPEEEYVKRLEEVRVWTKSAGLKLVEGEYDADTWFDKTKGLEDEPERGKRCEVCFDIRLSKAADEAGRLGFENYGAVLSVSPHKDSAVINRIGSDAGKKRGVKFFEADWKKKEGYKVTTRMAKDMGFYRQDYCGCVYSRRGRGKQ
ncbi:MAG TPA: epoxyqueuosine reductase QueH [Nitrospirae bacterium]|nr:epoxyqueuosine reductase QueH [Nitrospirota bacterium]